MREIIKKFKKAIVYILAIIGIVAILVFLVALVKQFSFGTSRSSLNYESTAGYQGVANDRTAKSLGVSDGIAYQDSYVEEDYGGDEREISERKISKNADVSLLVDQADQVAEKIQEIATANQGFVINSYIRENSDNIKSGTVSIKVPTNRFQAVLNQVKELAIKIESENVTAQDVTEQYVDLEAQLTNYRAEEQQYLNIMKQAYTVEDTLKVAAQLSNVRGRIERIQGQLKYLDRQVEMSIITAQLTAEAEIEVFGIRWRPLYEVKKSFHGMLEGLKSFASIFIAIIFFLPVLILWIVGLGVLFWIAWKIIKWLKKKFRKKPKEIQM